MLMCDSLRSSCYLRVVLLQALELCVPPVLLPSLKEAVGNPVAVAPSTASVSRWRLLLDAAFMLYMRSKNTAAASCSSGGFVRYLMSDSSTQHGRQFQLTSVLSVRRQQVARLMHVANDLVALW